MEQTTTNEFVCEACNLHMHKNFYEQHMNGKKHKIKQEQYDRKFKTIFVTGTSNFSSKDLEKIFTKYGQISKVQKHQIKPFSFIQFAEKESVERALNARIFAGGKRLFVKRYIDNRNQQNNQEENKEKSRKLSETLSSTSQGGGDAEQVCRIGVKDLPVQFADSDWCSELLWQAQNIVSQVELPPEAYQSLNEVQSDVEALFQPLMPGCQAVVFGSCGSQLAFKNSDVDLFLQTACGEQPRDFVRREAKEMYRSPKFKVITRIPAARVPIVKFEHLRTGWQGDLTANSQLGVCNSQLIRFLVSLDLRIKPLVMVIKYWAKVCGVTGNHSRFTTYSLVMLVIFYLQQLDPPMLPTIGQLQQMTQHKMYCQGWECSFCDEEWRVQTECLIQPNNLSFRDLLTGFFRFYHNFDFSNVICPLLGKSLPVKDFESVDGSGLPEEMFLYRENLKSDPKGKFKTDTNFRVQDPFELCLNITRNVSDRTCSVFKEACKVSLELCEKEDETSLLKSLFSIDEEALDVGEDCVKIHINLKEEASNLPEVSESFIAQWYEMTTDSVMLVLKEIYKFNIDPYGGEVSSKVKKIEASQDVHTPISSQKTDNSVFVCSGKANVWNSRKKMSKFMNSINISLDSFEREVCISNALHYPSDQNLFYFTLTISSLEDLKNGGKGIEVQVNARKRHPLIKGFIQSMKNDFKLFVRKAQYFINKIKRTSPVTEVKESLKELFELKIENLPNLKELLKRKNDIMAGKGSVDKKSQGQEVIMSSSHIVSNSGDHSNKTTCDSDITGSTNHELGGRSGGMKVHEHKSRPDSSNVGRILPENVENDVMKCVLPNENIPSVETQILIDQFFKSSSPREISGIEKNNTPSESGEVDKFNDLLNAIQTIETQSTFTSDDVNPFLASIEKIALKPLNVESKDGKMDDETEMESADSTAQYVENQGELKANKEKEADSFENPLRLRCETEEIKDQEEVSQFKDQEEVSQFKNQEEVSQFKDQEEVSQFKDQEEVSQFNKSDSRANFESDTDPEPVESISSFCQEKNNKNEVDNQASAKTCEQKSDFKIYLQRPLIHSERLMKQKKPNLNRFHRNPGGHPSHPRNGSPWQPWAGGGPPGCIPWQRDPQQNAVANLNSNEEQDFRGNHHQGSRRHYPPNRNIQRQKKCYPGLFRDGNC